MTASFTRGRWVNKVLSYFEIKWECYHIDDILSHQRNCPEPCGPLEWTTVETIKFIVIFCLKCSADPQHEPLHSPSWRGSSHWAGSNFGEIFVSGLASIVWWKFHQSDHFSIWEEMKLLFEYFDIDTVENKNECFEESSIEPIKGRMGFKKYWPVLI